MAYSSCSKLRLSQALSEEFPTPSLCCVSSHSSPSPPLTPTDAHVCVSVALDVHRYSRSLCPPTRQWLPRDEAGELAQLFARFSSSAERTNKSEYNIAGSKYVLVTRKRSRANVILIKQIAKARGRLVAVQIKCCLLRAFYKATYTEKSWEKIALG